jgi:hypothetical protein
MTSERFGCGHPEAQRRREVINDPPFFLIQADG